MVKNLHFRAVMEVVGKPKEHVEQTTQNYVENLEKNDRYEVVNKEFGEAQEREDAGMWATFVEVEAKTEKVEDLVAFCFDYMPSQIEVTEPKELRFSDGEVSQFLNDLQSKLHQVDMVAKHVKMENDILKRSMGSLLKNYITLLLANGPKTGDQLSKMTGITRDKLEDFLDQLIDEGRIDLKEETYYLIPRDERQSQES